MSVWNKSWQHGSYSVHARGGMLGSVRFTLPSGRVVSPLYEAPWLQEGGDPNPPLLRNLRSEFACVPFGTPYSPEHAVSDWKDSISGSLLPTAAELDASDSLLHGFASDQDWSLVDEDDNGLTISIKYPEHSPIDRLVRKVSPSIEGTALELSLTIFVKRDCERPVGLHPNFALPLKSGALELLPGRFEFGLVHPCGPEPEITHLQSGGAFSNLSAVPSSNGGSVALDRVPLERNVEEIVQLCGADGKFDVVDRESQAQYRLEWDSALLPSLLLWFSNRGRGYEPWNNRNLCLGVEPVVSAFELGVTTALSANPINRRGVATALQMSATHPTEIKYRLSASPFAD